MHEEIGSGSHDLVETLAERIAQRILTDTGHPLVRRVEVRVHKPSAPVGLPVGNVGCASPATRPLSRPSSPWARTSATGNRIWPAPWTYWADRRDRDRLDGPRAGDRPCRRARRAGRLPELRHRREHRPGAVRSARGGAPRWSAMRVGERLVRWGPRTLDVEDRHHLWRERDATRSWPPASPCPRTGLRARSVARRPARCRDAGPRSDRRARARRGSRRPAARPDDPRVRSPVKPLNLPILLLILVVGASWCPQMLKPSPRRGHSLPMAGWLTTVVMLALGGVLLAYGIPLRTRYMAESEERRVHPSLAPRRHQIDLPTAFRTVLLARACAYTGAGGGRHLHRAGPVPGRHRERISLEPCAPRESPPPWSGSRSGSSAWSSSAGDSSALGIRRRGQRREHRRERRARGAEPG